MEKNTEERHQIFHLQTIKEPLLKLALDHRYELQLFERRPQHQSHKELFQHITPEFGNNGLVDLTLFQLQPSSALAVLVFRSAFPWHSS